MLHTLVDLMVAAHMVFAGGKHGGFRFANRNFIYDLRTRWQGTWAKNREEMRAAS